jgi:2,3-dihydroxybenzoate-AMP ligase
MLEGCTPWPDDVAKRYRDAGYWEDRTLGDMLDDSIRAWGPKTAIVCGDRRLSYDELGRRVDGLAAFLAEAGLKSRDRVVFQLPNSPDFAVAFFALQRLGVIPVMALRSHRLSEIRHFVAHAGATGYLIPDVVGDFDFRDMAATVMAEFDHLRHVFVAGAAGPGQTPLPQMSENQGDAAAGRALLEERRPDPGEVALMLLSGGTTGLSKLIPRTHNDYVYNCKQCARATGLGPDSVYLSLLPLAHNYNLAAPGLLGVLASGGTVVLGQSLAADDVFPLIERERVTHVAAALPLIAEWLATPAPGRADLSSLRAVSNGGARLPEDLRRGVEATLGCTFIESYGTSEGLINQTGPDDPDEVRFTSSGRPISEADEIRIVDEDGNDLPDGTPGELLVRGPYTVRGYYRNPAADAKSFTADGFYRMGDTVRKQGRLLFAEGRKTDRINRGGEKISCEEVESHLHAHPKIESACVVAMPDPVYGEKACAFAIARAGERLTFAELKEFMLGREIAKFKIPERLELVDAFPLSPAGKILRRELVRIIAETVAAESGTNST